MVCVLNLSVEDETLAVAFDVWVMSSVATPLSVSMSSPNRFSAPHCTAAPFAELTEPRFAHVVAVLAAIARSRTAFGRQSSAHRWGMITEAVKVAADRRR